MPVMSQADLEKSLMEDLVAAKQRAQEGAQFTGSQVDENFAPRAVRSGNQVLAQRELSRSRKAIDKTVAELLGETNFADQLDSKKFEFSLTKKLRQLQLESMKRAAMLERQLAQQGVDAQKRAAIMQIAGKTLGSMTADIVGGIGGKVDPNTQGLAGSYKDPDTAPLSYIPV